MNIKPSVIKLVVFCALSALIYIFISFIAGEHLSDSLLPAILIGLFFSFALSFCQMRLTDDAVFIKDLSGKREIYFDKVVSAESIKTSLWGMKIVVKLDGADSVVEVSDFIYTREDFKRVQLALKCT